MLEIKVPNIRNFAKVAVFELMVKPGNTVSPNQSLISVQSDKALMEIPSNHGGVVKEFKVKIGDKIAEGSLVLLFDPAESASGSENVKFSELGFQYEAQHPRNRWVKSA